MIALIYGDSKLLQTLAGHVPQKRWMIPAGADFGSTASFLTRHPVPEDRRGYVLTNQPGNWLPVARAGWTVYWCEQGQTPVGTQPLPSALISQSVTGFVGNFWKLRVVDKRIVGDLLLNRTRMTAPLLPVTSNTGGVGKTVSCRRLAERASEIGVRTLLVDGNMLQSSQRSFFDPRRTHDANTLADWRPGMDIRSAANPGRDYGVAYDIAFAPPAGSPVGWQTYRKYIEEARKQWDFVVLDLDRVSADDLTNREDVAGGLLVPYLQSGETCLIIVKAGVQTQGDSMNLLSAFASMRMPVECIGIKDTVPAGLTDYRPLRYEGYGTFLGTEYQTIETGNLIAAGRSNWPDPNLDYVREQVLAWALPDRGFNPERFLPQQTKRKGWFHR